MTEPQTQMHRLTPTRPWVKQLLRRGRFSTYSRTTKAWRTTMSSLPSVQQRLPDRAPVTRRATSPGWRNSCCQMRRMRQPRASNISATVRSRLPFRSSFAVQNSRFVSGMEPWMGHPCQKQPSTKTARRAARKIKSGLPKIFARRRQPLISKSRKILISRISVARLPRLLTRAITSDRLAGVNTSATG